MKASKIVGRENTTMRIMRSGTLILILILLMINGFGCSANDETELKAYDFMSFLGMTKTELVRILGENYEVTTQGVNDQNLGLNYTDIGVLIGLDEAKDIVVEIEFLEGEYLGISANMTLEEAIKVMEMEKVETLTLNLNNIGKWYICDLGDFRVRLSEDKDGEKKMQYVITLQEFK